MRVMLCRTSRQQQEEEGKEEEEGRVVVAWAVNLVVNHMRCQGRWGERRGAPCHPARWDSKDQTQELSPVVPRPNAPLVGLQS
jgi:hypothetical protein